MNPGANWRNGATFAEMNYYSYNVLPNRLPADDEVVYGKVGHLGYLVHIAQLGVLVDA